jgi:hypothetical protein
MNTPSLMANPLVKSGFILAFKRQLYFLTNKNKNTYSISKRFEYPGSAIFALLKRNDEDLIAISSREDKIVKFY